jgi:hypothetical protein
MGKGAYRGRIEIPFDQLLSPPVTSLQLPLKHKIGMNAKKQTVVGGIMTVKYAIDLKPEVLSDTEEETFDDGPLVVIPRSIWDMETPAIVLTIKGASGLAAANMFGGSSDPFALIFVGDSPDPTTRTATIDNELDPVWNEKFTLNLGVSMEQGKTTIDSFPKIRIEVWDSNRVGPGEFLGCCEISPSIYFSKKEKKMELGPSSKLKAKKNKLAQGILESSFSVIDNITGIGKQSYTYTKINTLQINHLVEIQILKCRNLMKANTFGKSDPYVIVKWNGRDWGETSFKKDTLDPTWNSEKFLVNLSVAHIDVGQLVLEVWDKNFFADGEFMGEIRLSANDILHPQSGNQEMVLRNRPGLPPGKIRGNYIISYYFINFLFLYLLSFY